MKFWQKMKTFFINLITKCHKPKHMLEDKRYELGIKQFKNKYRLTAEAIFTALGELNYQKPYNCMTRFRVNIIDASKVDVEAIKKIPLVKGIKWNGPELQIIIGGEVPKVLDEFKEYEREDKTITTDIKQNLIKRPPFGKRFLAAIVGIIQPSIAVIIAGGMLVAVYSLLSIEGGPIKTSLLVNGDPVNISMQTLYLFGVWDALFYILANTVMPSIGLFFIYNTARYFNANPWFAIAVGLFLLSQGFFPLVLHNQYEVAKSIDDAQFGQWISDEASGKNGFFLFAIGSFPIVIMGYQGSIIPFIVGGLLVVYLDKWIKTWMPAALDITFRGLLVIILTMGLLWFALAPLSSLIEYALFEMMTWVGNIPYGIGAALFTALWQPLVIIGCHTPLGVMLDTSIANGTPQVLGTANVSAYWGQLGAVVAVGITTKNMSLKRMAFATVPAGVFGITEPIIYGVNLPRVKPFMIGCLGALVGGFFIGILDLDMDLFGTFGILSLLRFNDAALVNGHELAHKITYTQGTEIGLLVMTWAITFAVSFVITFFFYKERTNEMHAFKASMRKLARWTHINHQVVLNEFATEQATLKSMQKDYVKVYKYYGEVSKIEYAYLMIEAKENKKRDAMFLKLEKMQRKLAYSHNDKLYAKFQTLNNIYETFELNELKQTYAVKKDRLIKAKMLFIEDFDRKRQQLLKQITTKIQAQKLAKNQQEYLVNNIWNAMESVEIAFDLIEPRNTNLKG